MIDEPTRKRAKSFLERLQEEKQTYTTYVDLIHPETGIKYYYFVVFSATLYDKFIKALEMNVIPDFAVIVAKGTGEPDEATKQRMIQYYNYDYDKEVLPGRLQYKDEY